MSRLMDDLIERVKACCKEAFILDKEIFLVKEQVMPFLTLEERLFIACMALVADVKEDAKLTRADG